MGIEALALRFHLTSLRTRHTCGMTEVTHVIEFPLT